MIRVVLPAHLRALARIHGEVHLDITGPVTQRSVLDALEARYPMLRGTIRGHQGGPRRAFIRFFACELDLSHDPPDGQLRVYRSRTGGDEWEPLTSGLPQRHCYVNVLRDAMAVDSLDPCGIYFGTTGGQVYASPDAGDTWAPIVHNLPAVLSVEVQTLP